MDQKDLRPEQVKLLRFEKALIRAAKDKASGKPLNKTPILAGLAAVTAAGASAAAKLGSETPLKVAADIEAAARAAGTGDAWLINLAEVVSKSHNAVETLAQKGAFVLMQAGGGSPKEPPSEAVSFLLMNGLF